MFTYLNQSFSAAFVLFFVDFFFDCFPVYGKRETPILEDGTDLKAITDIVENPSLPSQIKGF